MIVSDVILHLRNRYVHKSFHTQMQDTPVTANVQCYPKPVFLSTYGNRSKRIAEEDIAYLKADRDNCNVFMKDGQRIIVGCPMKQLLEVINRPFLVRTHRSYAINLNMAIEICKTMIVLDDCEKTHIPIGKEYNESVFQRVTIIGSRNR